MPEWYYQFCWLVASAAGFSHNEMHIEIFVYDLSAPVEILLNVLLKVDVNFALSSPTRMICDPHDLHINSTSEVYGFRAF